MFLAYLAIGVLVLIGIVLALKAYAYADTAKLARTARWVTIGLAVIGFMLLMLRVPLGLLFFVLSGLMPLLLRWPALWQAGGARSGRASRIDTHYLSMVLDHDTGGLDGTVLAGRHQGKRLSALSLAELAALRNECASEDPDSVTLIDAYLDRVHGAAAGGEQAGGGEAGPRPAAGRMTREEAYDVLGLGPGAGEAEIRDAHRRLMMKLHPDQGGSNYLAAKLNQAKDLLLGD